MTAYSITYERLPATGDCPIYMIAISPASSGVHLKAKNFFRDRKEFEAVLRNILHFDDKDISDQPQSESAWERHRDINLSRSEAQSIGWTK